MDTNDNDNNNDNILNDTKIELTKKEHSQYIHYVDEIENIDSELIINNIDHVPHYCGW